MRRVSAACGLALWWLSACDAVHSPQTPTPSSETLVWQDEFDGPGLILNLAVGGSWGGQRGIDDSAFPTRFAIDYVRVYRL